MKVLVNRHWKMFLFAGLFLYLFIISLQSLTFTDEGFYLSSYQTFFPDPASNGYFFMYYMTMLIGGIWEKIAGGGGILSFRLLNNFTVLVCVWIACFSFRSLTDKKIPLVMASIFTVVFLSFSLTSFSYNTLSLFLACLLFLQIVQYYQTDSYKYIVYTGFIVGVSLFTRIPNILFLIIPAPVLLAKRAGMTIYFSLMCGFLCGILFVLLLMTALGHVPLFIQVIQDVFTLGTSNESAHGISKMFDVYIYNIRDVLAVVLTCYAIYSVVQRKLIKTVILLVLVISYWVMALTGFVYRPGLYGVIYGVLYFSLILYWRNNSWCHSERSQLIALHSYLGMSLTFIYPIGSDHGIYNVANISTFWLCFVICIIWLDDYRHATTYRIALVIISFFTIVVLDRVVVSPSFSKFSRIECVMKPRESSLANIYMTPEMTTELDRILKYIKKYTKKGDYVLCYPNIPMINYLSETRPYLYNCWPRQYTRSLLKHYLDKAVTEKESLPVVVRQKHFIKDDKFRLLKEFVTQNHYRIVVSDSKYEVLVSTRVRVQ